LIFFFFLDVGYGGNRFSRKATCQTTRHQFWKALSPVSMLRCKDLIPQPLTLARHMPSTVGSRFATGLRSWIFCCKSNRRKTSTI